MSKAFAMIASNLLFIPAVQSNQPITLLITGGAGYIGSATVLLLAQKKYNVVVIDKEQPKSACFANYPVVHSTQSIYEYKSYFSHEENRVLFIQSDYAAHEALNAIFTTFPIDAVIHCAAFLQVGESVNDPASYYENNVVKTFKLLEAMRRYDVKKIIFSSSCAVYGDKEGRSIREEERCTPISPYGNTKVVVELLLKDYAHAYGIQSIALRYFNAAGALPSYDIGERDQAESHLIPLVLKAAYNGSPFYVFGTDYPTKDGTCIRDYLHIYDLAQAHYCALTYFTTGVLYDVFNLGTGFGYSVYEIITTVESVTGKKVNAIGAPKRSGDTTKLTACADKALRLLHWKPSLNLLDIIQSAHSFYTHTYILKTKLKIGEEKIL